MESPLIRAYHLRSFIELDSVELPPLWTVISRTTQDIFAKNDQNHYYHIAHYGSFASYHSTERDDQVIMAKLRQKSDPLPVIKDEYILELTTENVLQIKFDRAVILKPDQETIKILLMMMAHSVALAHYDQFSQELIAKVRMHTTNLENKGRLTITTRNILKMLGRVHNAQNQIAETLYIFDAPGITWQHAYYNKVYQEFSLHFELSHRYRSIDNTFKIAEASLKSFLEVKHHNESSKLEWIIIILILVEIIDTFVSKVW